MNCKKAWQVFSLVTRGKEVAWKIYCKAFDHLLICPKNDCPTRVYLHGLRELGSFEQEIYRVRAT